MVQPVIVIIGPTAVGKTAVAMALQDLAGGPERARLISADSAMVYRGLDIGTAKPTPVELARYPHDLIDIRDIADPYTTADFVADADRCVLQARQTGRLPIIVGGTMLYVKRFVEGIAELPQADPAMRESLEAHLRARGGTALHEELARLDPEAAAGIHPNNPQRLLRALEVVRLTGEPISALWQRGGGPGAADRLGGEVFVFSIEPDNRRTLHERIEQRFDAMLEQGFLKELDWLHEELASRDDVSDQLPALRAVGYRQGLQHLSGEYDSAGFRRRALTATRRLAKRQLTWLRQWQELRRLQWGEPRTLADAIAAAAGLN